MRTWTGEDIAALEDGTESLTLETLAVLCPALETTICQFLLPGLEEFGVDAIAKSLGCTRDELITAVRIDIHDQVQQGLLEVEKRGDG